MKWLWSLAVAAFVILTGAAITLGSLNQDEGWYLYAARLVSEGQMLYADFAFTQGPLLPTIYGALASVWLDGGLLAARVLTSVIGLLGLIFALALARRLVPTEHKNTAALLTFLLLGSNLYHLYYTAIPKTYALASLFVLMGYYLLATALTTIRVRMRPWVLFLAGLTLAFAAGTRISLGVLLAVCGVGLLVAFRQYRFSFLWFGCGGFAGLALVYAPYLLNAPALDGLIAAQKYHAARGGFDIVFFVGSLSRLVRWYAPIFVLFGLGVSAWLLTRKGTASQDDSDSTARFVARLVFIGFLLVLAVQMAAPFPYEDYQVPVMGLFAVAAACVAVRVPLFVTRGATVLLPIFVLGLTWAGSFGSPLLEQWTTNGQDRFWTRVKAKPELVQLREMAHVIEAIDPGGKTLLTQDLYLAIETGRKVPKGLEMGPFSILTDAEWRRLLSSAPTPVAALSGYTFAIEPPRCSERPLDQQLAYWDLLKKQYELVLKEDAFGQQATPLLILKRKATEK